jgi:hypothetical protein
MIHPDTFRSHQTLVDRLNSLRNAYARNRVLRGALLLVSLALGLAFLGLWMNSVLVLPAPARVLYLGLAALILVIVFSYFCIRPVLHKPGLEDLALKVEDRFPGLHNRLIAALQLSRYLKRNPEGYSTDLIEEVIRQAESTSQGLNLKGVIDRSSIRRMGRLAAILAVLTLVFGLIFPLSFRTSLYVLSHPLTEFAPAQRFFFVISPGDAEVVKFSDLRIKINVEGEKPGNVDFFWRNQGAGWNKERLSSAGPTTATPTPEAARLEPDFVWQFKEVKRNLEYYAQAKGVKSELYNITVVDKPRIVGLKLTFDYPAYTRLKPLVVDENDGNITAIAGTRVGIEAKANKQLDRADIVFSDSTVKPAKVDGNVASGDILVRKDVGYHLRLWDPSGNQNPDPIEYKITKLDDQYPTVDILEPGHDQDLSESMQVGLLLRISDDYGFSSLKLKYQVMSGDQEAEERTREIEIPQKNQPQASVEYVWSLSDLPLVPGDVVRYRAVVYDNDTFSGPKKAESQTYHLRLPSLDEMIAEVEREQEGQITDLETVLRGQKDLKKKIEDLSQEMNRWTGLDMDWQKKQQMEDALDKQRKLASDLKDVAQKMDQSIKKVQENKLAAAEMVEKMMEIKKLMEEVATPELKEAMRKLAEALKNMDPEQLKEAVKNMQLSAEEMLKRLERTLSLLKRMQAEQKLSDLVKMAQQMAEKQDQINQNTQSSDKEDLPKLTSDENQLKDQLGQFQDKLKEFSDLASELSMLPQERLEDLENMPQESGVEQNMDQMNSQLSKMNRSGALSSGGSCHKKLQQMKDQLTSAQDDMQAAQKEEIVKAIRKSLYDVFSLSDNQEQLFDQVSLLGQRDLALRDRAGDQQNLKSAGIRISEDLEALSRITLYVSQDVLRYVALSVAGMQEAMSRLDERQREIATDEQKEAIYDLNLTARKLMLAMVNAQKSCSGSGMQEMFEKMKSMCDKQCGLNQETAQLGQCNSGQGMKLSLDQQAAMQRLAAEQDAVRKALSELEREFGSGSEVAGRLDKIGQEMKKVVEDFERMQVDQGTMDRQSQILSRLLDAEKSMRERDYSKQRRAEVGEDVVRATPDQLSPEVGQQDVSAQDNLSKYMQEGYPKEYEQLIKEYFKALSDERMKK